MLTSDKAVTLGMVMVKAISYVRGCLLFGAQITGAIFASYIVSILFPTSFSVGTTLSKSTSAVQGVFIEALLTAELTFAIFMLAKEKHRATFMAPIGIGLTLFVAELVGVYYTGGVSWLCCCGRCHTNGMTVAQPGPLIRSLCRDWTIR